MADQEARVEELLQKQDRLRQRLQKGREVLSSETDDGGEKADQHFEYWLTLLTDYEQSIDQLRALGVREERLGH